MPNLDPNFVAFLTPAAAVMLILFYLNLHLASPLLAIVIRWMRWVLFSLFVAYAAIQFEMIDRPFWVIATTAFLGWFLVESVFNWLRVSAISLSPLPLFPKFVVNTSGEEWPTQKRLLQAREWLRANRFNPVQALKAEVGGGIWLRVSIYQSQDAMIRLQIAFLPQESGTLTVCYSLSTETKDGLRYVTDNYYLPFGGFYPENWLVERTPWRRSLASLVNRHSRRIATGLGGAGVPWQTDPLDDINQQQHLLEQVNTELGFLLPHTDHEEYGKITPEGRFRIWKEAFLLNYLGISSRYS
ncbi:MAG: hypothetical protein PHQ04_00750 [Opitutaceae bacterium]|nr:hypothetical protein [Opitutaceae bacterium]